MLGNLTVKQIQDRLGIEFPQDIQDFMRKSNQSEANNIAKGKWHCFDIPFTIVFGDYDIAKKVYDALKDKSDDCKEQLQFSIQK